ncbi:hypothetical protein DTO96_101866 [Ephemeroptericola cinctiostellae]|uniref:Uncharacterized protein n=1 Tax=Ephemeroptericola cinctiostellae TaxID=2268024 RepID=A0A345DCN7_9BURK|nr:hypothetical protein DTO96_101866 [Ephemeroptericola cinctiostellae]
MGKPKKFIIPASVPRNPLVAAAKLRRAGSHRPSQKAERQQQARALRQQLKKIKSPVDDDGAFLSGSLHFTAFDDTNAKKHSTYQDITCAAQRHQFGLDIYHHGLCMRFHTLHLIQRTRLAHTLHSRK